MGDQDFVPAQAGTFRIELSKEDPATRAWFFYRCPCGCGSIGQLSLIQPMNAKHDKRTWNWDGNSTEPTLSPSIRRNVECKFHGHMQKGIWTACSDGPPVSKQVWRPEKLPHQTAIMGNRPENVIMDDPINQKPDITITVEDKMSPALEKLAVDMQGNPSLTARQILQGERLPPPEFNVLLATIEREIVEGSSSDANDPAPPPKMYLMFGERIDMVADYAHKSGIDPARYRFVQRPADILGAGPEKFELSMLTGWDTDYRKRQCYIALKRSIRWRQYFQQHPELP